MEAENQPQEDTTQAADEAASVQGVYETRLAKLDLIKKTLGNPYPAKSDRTHTLLEVRQSFDELQNKGEYVTVVGRIMAYRTHGGITFMNLRDGTGEFQLVFQQDVLPDVIYAVIAKDSNDPRLEDGRPLDLGDFIQVTGAVFTTKRGELSIQVKSEDYENIPAIVLLAKSLRPLPDKRSGLKDPEERYRRRYLDMIANPEVREKLVTRAKVTRALRDFLHQRDFVEIENPVLETVASGAAATPFATHINAYDLDVYLRISIGELWQKRSLVGGFEKVFEIGRAFRNEGVDYSHNPDFAMLEYYWAYADYEDNLKLHDELIPFVVEQAAGSLQVPHDGQTIDFTGPYPRLTFQEAVKTACGVDIGEFLLAGDEIDGAGLAAAAKEATGTDYSHLTPNKILDDLFKDTWRLKQLQPAFVTHYPAVLKPLAKRSAADPRYAEMFQLIVAGMELSNSYTELNDPVDQRRRFAEQATLAAAGDAEAMPVDEDFVEALEYGMPPATGTGIGIDRFAALLTDSHSIREVTAYPLMKPRGGSHE